MTLPWPPRPKQQKLMTECEIIMELEEEEEEESLLIVRLINSYEKIYVLNCTLCVF